MIIICFKVSFFLQFFTLPSSQVKNCCEATLPACQASKLHLCQAVKPRLLYQATLPSSQTATMGRDCPETKPSRNCWTSNASKSLADNLVVLSLSHRVQAATYDMHNNLGPIPCGSGPIQTQTRPQPATCLGPLLKLLFHSSQFIKFGSRDFW